MNTMLTKKKGTLILFLQQKSNKDKFLYLPKTSFHILKTFNDNLITYAIKYFFFFFSIYVTNNHSSIDHLFGYIIGSL